MRGISLLTVAGVLLLVVGLVLAAVPEMLSGEKTVTSVKPVSKAVEKPVVVTVTQQGRSGEARLSYKVYNVEHIMSAVYKVYGNPELGFWVAKTVVENKGSAPLYDVRISYKIEGFTDWSEPEIYPEIVPGGAVVSLYYPILPPSIAETQTTTPSRLYVRIEYRLAPDGKSYEERTSKPLQVLGRHDFVFSGIPPEESTGSFYDLFSNYPLLAAWVTPKDPPVEYFADMANKLVGGAGASLNDEEAIKFLAAAWQLSLANHITYQTEPQAFWTGKQAQWIKYPRDVLRDKSGTCIDTAIFYASLAMSQGLKAYIIIMPGHAFPIIQLPGGQLVPVETTLLNRQVSFKEAVETGVKVAMKAFSGPYLVVDVASLQARGIVPPELPPIKISELNLVTPEQEASNAATPTATATVTVTRTTTATQTATPTGTSTRTETPAPGGWSTYVNNKVEPYWSIAVPPGFTTEEDFNAELPEVDFMPSNGDNVLVAVLWTNKYSLDDLRQAAEAFFEQYFGAPTKTHGPTRVAIGGVEGIGYGYENDKGVMAVALVGRDSYNFAIVVVADINAVKKYGSILNDMLNTFAWR